MFRRLRAPSTFVIDENAMSRTSGIMNDKTLMEAIFLKLESLVLCLCDDSFGVFEFMCVLASYR